MASEMLGQVDQMSTLADIADEVASIEPAELDNEHSACIDTIVIAEQLRQPALQLGRKATAQLFAANHRLSLIEQRLGP